MVKDAIKINGVRYYQTSFYYGKYNYQTADGKKNIRLFPHEVV